MRTSITLILLATVALSVCGGVESSVMAGEQPAKIKLLIVDGQNNHGSWPKTTFMMKKYLEEAGRFTVDVARTAFTTNGGNLLKEYPLERVETTPVKRSRTDPNFKPEFSKYDVVLSNFGAGAAPWPEETKRSFEKFVRDGGGFVVIHAANNSFGNWPEYNEMIGVGGWGGRNVQSGPYVYLDADGNETRSSEKGPTGLHGPRHEFPIIVRDASHPVTQDMPNAWMHAQDELYDYLRGPAVNMTVLATALSAQDKNGSGNHVPMIMSIQYGKGRIFHTPMGHDDGAMMCVGYITTLLRGCEWAATGKVTIPIPEDFPTADKASRRKL